MQANSQIHTLYQMKDNGTQGNGGSNVNVLDISSHTAAFNSRTYECPGLSLRFKKLLRHSDIIFSPFQNELLRQLEDISSIPKVWFVLILDYDKYPLPCEKVCVELEKLIRVVINEIYRPLPSRGDYLEVYLWLTGQYDFYPFEYDLNYPEYSEVLEAIHNDFRDQQHSSDYVFDFLRLSQIYSMKEMTDVAWNGVKTISSVLDKKQICIDSEDFDKLRDVEIDQLVLLVIIALKSVEPSIMSVILGGEVSFERIQNVAEIFGVKLKISSDGAISCDDWGSVDTRGLAKNITQNPKYQLHVIATVVSMQLKKNATKTTDDIKLIFNQTD